VPFSVVKQAVSPMSPEQAAREMEELGTPSGSIRTVIPISYTSSFVAAMTPTGSYSPSRRTRARRAV